MTRSQNEVKQRNPIRGTIWLPADIKLDEIEWEPLAENNERRQRANVKRERSHRSHRKDAGTHLTHGFDLIGNGSKQAFVDAAAPILT